MQVPKITGGEMELFSGERNADGMMNWKPVNSGLTQSAAPEAEEASANYLRAGNFDRPVFFNSSGSYDVNKQWLIQNLTAAKFRATKFKLFDDSVFEARRKYISDNHCNMSQDQVSKYMNAPLSVSREFHERYNIASVFAPLKFSDHVYWNTFGNHTYTLVPNRTDRNIFLYQKDSIFGLEPLKETPDEKRLAELVKNLDGSQPASTLTMVDTSGPVRDNIIIERKAKTKIKIEYYDPIEIANLGWINCDRFYNIPGEVSPEFTLDIKGALPQQVGVFTIFKNMNSMLFVKGALNGKPNCRIAQNIPVGTEVDIIIYSKVNNGFVQCKKTVTMTKGMVIPVELVPVPPAELKKVFLAS
jgi:hypothetical protein